MQNAEFQVKKEAAWTFCNICTGGRPEHVQCVVERYGVIDPLIQLLKLEDTKLVIAVLVCCEPLFPLKAMVELSLKRIMQL